MAHSHMRYNGSVCVQDKIYFGTFVRVIHGSACVQNRYIMTHLHVEHIKSACLQDMMYLFGTFSCHSQLCPIN